MSQVRQERAWGRYTIQMIPLALIAGVLISQQKMDLRPRFEQASTLPGIPSVTIDSYLDGMGIALPLARNKGVQARILWIDATANIERYNSDEKIVALVDRIKSSGFNTIVFDIKPISGQVVYKTPLAPKLEEWRGRLLPAEYDPLETMCREAKRAGLSLIVSLNAFSEGHSMFKVGPGYAQPEHQTVIYEPKPVLVLNGSRQALAAKVDTLEAGAVSVFTSSAKIPAPQAGAFTVTLKKTGHIVDGFEFGGAGQGVPTVPSGGVALYATGEAAEFLRRNTVPGQRANFDTDATFLPMAQSKATQIPLMMNPHDPVVWEREVAIAKDVAARYPVDGLIYDDRLRYAGIDADFSEIARTKFERVVGQKLNWPDDVFRFTLNQNLTRGVRPGRFYDQWMAWRASVLRDYLAAVRKEITQVRPGTKLGVYVGSWYGEYPALGHNYASPKAEAGFWFLSKNYRTSGSAPAVDYVIPGAYYTTATIHEAMQKGIGIGNSVEAAGHVVNRLVRDEAWTYAGLSLIDFRDNPEGLMNALQAACTATQGVMVFDLSHEIEPMWPVFARAFSQPAKPPHMTNLLAEVRKQRAARDKLGIKEPPITITAGSAGIGQ